MKYIFIVLVAILLFSFMMANGQTVLAPENIEKTLEGEIDRLSIKYNVASSTVRAVAKCESSMYGSAINYNYRKDGTLHSIDKGYLQINNLYHEPRMNQLGLDWNDEWDSLEYGFMLMAEQGLQPWSASRFCWIKLI